MRKLHIGGATVNQTPLDWTGNLDHIVEAIREAKRQKIDLLCFPELSITAYGCEDLFLSKWLPEKAIEMIPKIADECEGIVATVGLPIVINNETFNCVCVINNQEVLGISVKQYLPIDGVHYETRWFTQWKANTIQEYQLNGKNVPFGDVVYDLHGVSFGFEICEDAWRMDRPGHRLHKRNIDLILNPSASHFALQKTIERQNLVVDSSANFECTYLYSNLLGNEAGRMIYDGEIVIASKGNLLNKNKHLSFQDFNIVSQQIDFDDLQAAIPASFTEVLPANEEFIRASALGLFDYLRKSQASGFVLSLSGGADSATCAVLIAEMVKRACDEIGQIDFLKKIGKPEIIELISDLDEELAFKTITASLLTCAYQSSQNSSKGTFEAARQLAESIGAVFHHWTIDEEVESYTAKIQQVLGRNLSWEQDDIALQNIQARVRSPIIWMLANVKNALLLTTSNRSEGDVGYATMDGDTSGSLAPIAAIDKPFIRNWLRWAEKELGYSSLNTVNKLVPTAELRPPNQKQSDEEDLMPYDILVQIERSAIRDHQSPVQVFHELLAKNLTDSSLLKVYIKRFFTLWSRNQWKRERMAPSFHLDDFNVDPKTWCRFPIVSGGFQEELKELDQISI